jgi:uncharacterized protein
MMTNNMPPAKIAITGATGFIGKTLCRFLMGQGYQVTTIGRNHLKEGSSKVAQLIAGAQYIINLAGAPILKKWTEAYKQEIYHSRILTTRILVEAIQQNTEKPELFISASAVGIYNNVDIHDEFSELYDTGFLGNVCLNWEKETHRLANQTDMRLAIFRFGVVLGKNGGAYPLISLPFKLFVGGKIGNGLQWFPFIHINDVLGAFKFVMDNPTSKGIYNLVAPNMVTNVAFGKELAKQLHRPCWLPVPPWGLKVLYGEAVSTLTEGQYVKPHRLVTEGYHFHYPNAIETIKALTK